MTQKTRGPAGETAEAPKTIIGTVQRTDSYNSSTLLFDLRQRVKGTRLEPVARDYGPAKALEMQLWLGGYQ